MERASRRRAGMRPLIRVGAMLVSCSAAAVLFGYGLGRQFYVEVPALIGSRSAQAAPEQAAGPVIYYRDPTGKPAYSSVPRKTAAGQDFRPVYAGEDVSLAEPDDEPDPAPAAAAPSRRVLYYRNPMGLADVSPTPKKDSMGMDYIAVYEGENGDGSRITVTPGRLQRSGVKTELAAFRTLEQPVRAPGSIQLDERRVAVVALRAEGFVERVEPVTTGDRVRRGQPLLRFYSPEISAASAQYLTVINEVSGAGGRPSLVEGARRRLENLSVPSEAVAEIERTRRVPGSILWAAPRDGIVLERNVSDGMRAMAGDPLFRIGDLSVVWAIVDISERDLPAVAIGQPAAVRARGYPDQAIQGRVTMIYPQLGRATRTARLRVELANPDGRLLPEMYVDAEIATGPAAAVLTVPESAVLDSGTRQVVFVDQGDGRFEPRAVKVGRRGTDHVEIREGVEDQERVVVAAAFLLDSESNLKAALRSLALPGAGQ